MKELSERFTGRGEVKGFNFTQLRKSEKGFLYKVESDESVHFEVFKYRETHRVIGEMEIHGVTYPSSKAFGRWAWCTKDESKANQLFDQL
jgi:hypothetical protein